MRDPIKIIHKFKNNNRRIQYKVYIFVGSLVPEEIIKILELIKNKDFYSSLTTITLKQYNLLKEYYGNRWYEKFYISYHIKFQIKQIEDTIIKKNELINKYGKEWYSEHINKEKLFKITYAYESNYYDNLNEKKKFDLETKKKELNFKTHNFNNFDLNTIKITKQIIEQYNNNLTDDNNNLTDDNNNLIDDNNNLIDDNNNLIDDNNNLTGGRAIVNNYMEVKQKNNEVIKENEINIEEVIKENEDTNKSVINKDDEEIEPELDEEELDEIIDNSFNINEISKLYEEQNNENNKTVNETTKLISDAINDKKWEKKEDESIIEYDDKLDNIAYDTKLEDIFIKHYIFNEYIFKDDTIKTLRQKITINIPISESFSSGIKILPETQYLWSEYYNQTGKDEIMIGQKWIRKNELLKIDIIPNENITIYEKLKNNLSYLKDAFGFKIKREDDENNIIRFYEDYIIMNEFFMIDIYNDLGLKYNPDPQSKKNVYDVYVSIYFPFISYDRFENIIDLLKTSNPDKELQYIKNIYNSIKNDIKLEKEVYTIVEKTKDELDTFNKYFNVNHIIQSNIHININNIQNITGTVSTTKYNLYRIFDNFIVNDEYPFIQYQTMDSHVTYKFYTKTEKLDNSEVISKWFENSPYGISFKILIENNKYIAINLYESGRIEYKITWKEDDNAIIDNIIKTYEYIRNLLKKINSENKKIKFIMPTDDKFKYAFINTIQKFTIPESFKINHNDLSDFCRLFFPYISLVIEPKKRVSKKNEVVEKVSKYGTYLRYKRISKFDNLSRMHLRIIYFIKNYEINEREIIDEISKQFNITKDYAIKEIDFVKVRYSKAIKKTSRSLKKLKILPKSKPPGIGIDIQGRDRDKYKIRITGARNREQLEEIVEFMKVLIFLYCETYLLKKPKYQKLKETLKLLSNVAMRRNKVVEIVDYERDVNTVKTMTSLDKKRLGYKPEKGQNQWTRSCQNSGNDKKRRPDITNGENIENIIKSGYKLNDKTGFYEKQVEITIKKKKKLVTIRAIKLTGENNTYNYYTCNPDENKEHFYIGFLSRGNNPSDLCMPCCFKKDQITATNKNKKNYYLKCIGEKSTDTQLVSTSNLGDKIYILQETNKVQDGRFIYLPKYLDILFNQVWNNDHKIKNHYLYESKSGYYFKYTVKNDNYNFLIALSNIFEIEITEIINLIIKFLENDKDDIYFTYLNNGDIRETFNTKDKFIEYIKTSQYLEYDMVGELLSIPGVLSKKGLYFFIMEKNNVIIKKLLEKDNIIEKYYLNCLNYENNFMMNEDRDFIILIKDDKYYHPIYRVQRDQLKDKKINLEKVFTTNKQIEEIKSYSNKSCSTNLISKVIGNYLLFSKNIINSLKDNIKIKKQYIDNRNKVKYLLLDNNLLLPTFPSGISYTLNYDNVNNITKLISYNDAINELTKINKVLNMDYIPKIIFYDKKEKDKIRIISIFLENELIMPIKSEFVTEKELTNMGIPSRFQTLNEEIDASIEKYNKNPIKIIDPRHTRVKQHLFKNEAYNIYRLELSLYLEDNEKVKKNIINIVNDVNNSITDKKNELRKILFNIINNKLASQLGAITKIDTFVELENDLPNLEDYTVNNLRDYCKINKTKNTCNENSKSHCVWSATDNVCKLRLTENLAIDFVNKVIEEMVQNNIQFKELIQENNYYVSDIVDYNQYSYRPNQQIINTANFNLNKIMASLFGKNNTPMIGRKQVNKKLTDNIIEDYPELVELGKQLYQPIVSNKDSIIRAFVNCYYWINNSLYDIESRNLGYFSVMQTLLTNMFKAKIIDFIQNAKNDNNDKYNKYLEKYFNNDKHFFDITLNKFRKQSNNTDCKLELLVLSLLTDYRIVVYNNYYVVINLYLHGDVKVNEENINNFIKEEYRNKTIYIKLDFDGSNKIPKNISSIYYK